MLSNNLFKKKKLVFNTFLIFYKKCNRVYEWGLTNYTSKNSLLHLCKKKYFYFVKILSKAIINLLIICLSQIINLQMIEFFIRNNLMYAVINLVAYIITF